MAEKFTTREGPPLPVRHEPKLDVPPKPCEYPGGHVGSDKGTLSNVPTKIEEQHEAAPRRLGRFGS